MRRTLSIKQRKRRRLTLAGPSKQQAMIRIVKCTWKMSLRILMMINSKNLKRSLIFT
jgi:hypothetical protein